MFHLYLTHPNFFMKLKIIAAVFLVLLGIKTTNAQVNLNDSLLAYLPLNGNASDVSGQNNNANSTLNGVYPGLNRQGIQNQSLFFNGEHEQGLLDFGVPLLNGRTQLTVSLWFNISSLLNGMSIFGQDNLFEIGFYTGPNRLSIFHPTSGTTNVSLSATLNTWQHLAITTTSSQMRIYLNGILMNTINGNHVIGTNTINTRVGGNVVNQSNNSFFRGFIDELRLYNKVLNTQEIEILSASSPITILPLNLNTTELCAGKSYSLPLMIFGTGLQSGNLFTAQLSDENGNFSQPLTIGTKLSVNSDTIQVTIPDFVATGSNYKIRIVSSFPQLIGNTSIQTYTLNNAGDGWTTLKRNRLLWYQFNTNAGDSSGNGFHATLNGGASYGADRFGNPVGALQLNGVSAFAAAPSGVWFNGPFTVSCWVKPNSITNWARLFDFGNGSASDNVTATLFQGTANRQQAETYISNLSSGFALTNAPGLRLNQWNHYLVQFDGTTIRIFIDGVLAASANSGIPKFITRLNCWIGRSNWAADAFSNASFDDFMLFNRSLTTNEIQALANDGLIIHNPIPCAGNVLQLNAPFLTGATYQWSGPNGFSSTLRQPIIANVGTANSGTYQLVIKQGLCDSIVTTKLITINNLAVQPTITFNSLPPVLNTGSTPINLSATPTGGTFFGNGVTGTTFNPTSAGEGDHIILYSVLNASGCYTNRADTTTIYPSYPMTNTVTTACNGGFYDAEGPNQNYSSNQSIIHTFYSGSNQRLQFNFSAFGLAQGDTLFIFDGPDTSSFLIAYYIQNSAPDIIWSKDSALTFWFKSDGANVGSGWNASFTCMTNPIVSENTAIRSGMHQICNGVLLDPGGTGNYGYGYWQQTIRANEGTRLRFSYTQFNVNGNNGGHWLSIYDGPTTASPLIGSYNNFNFIPAIIESTGEYLTFVFNSNNTNASLQSGFSGNLTCTTPILPVIVMDDNIQQTCSAVWYDQGGPTNNYANNLNQVQSFVVTNGKLRFTFNPNESQLGSGDSLFVYDGIDTTAQLISVLVNGSNFEPIKSKDSTLTFKFTSNSSSTNKGWQAYISCVPIHFNKDTFALSSGVRYTCDAIIRDPGGTGNYGYGFWRQTFASYNGNRIRLNFTELNVNGNNGGHWVTVYDGPDATFPVIGSYNEWSWPPNSMVESTGRFLTVEFNSNNTNASTRPGFTATLTCTTPVLQVINMSDTVMQVCDAIFYDNGGASANYSDNRTITQTLCSDSNQKLQFVFNNITTQFGTGDTLWVYDGSSTAAQLIAVYIQGSTIEPLLSNGSCLTFVFKSNATSNGRGWQANVSCVNTNPTQQNFALSSGVRYTCDAIIRDPGGTGNYGYGFWRQTFASYNGNRIRLNFTELNVNGNNGGHWVTVYDGPDATFPVIGSYNEWSWPPNSMVESTGRFLTIELNSNNTNASTRPGFTATLTCTTPVLQVINMSDTVMQVCDAIFYDNGGASANYSDNRTITQTLCSDNNQKLQFVFNNITTQFGTGDTLWVYDGSSTAAQLIAVYIQGSTIEPLLSTGTCLTFVFKSNATSNGRGWQANVSCVNTNPTQQNFALSSGVRYTCDAIIRDPGGTGNYGYGFWRQTFASYNGNRIRLNFTELNVNGNNGGHWVTIYDGPDATFPVIGSYNEWSWPPNSMVESTGRFLTVEFNSNNTNASNRPGFTATLTCTTPVLQVINMSDTVMQVCDAIFYDNGGATANYADNLNQTLTLQSASGLPLQLMFNSTVTQFNTGDTLRIYDGNNTTAPLLGTYVSGSILETLTSSGTSLTFRFTSNGTLNSRGWQAYVSCVNNSNTAVNYVMSSGERFTCNGVFTDPGGNGNYPYGTFVQTFTSYSGQRIRAVRTLFNINQFNGGHFLDVYDGTSINAPLIGTYNNGNLPPTAIQSTGGSLTFRLRSGNTSASTQAGFSFNLSCFTGSAVDVSWLNSPICQGGSLQVPFVRNNPVGAGNVYTVQLSDSAGNFGNPVNVGTFSSTDSVGNIAATIPTNTLPGTNYRIRITTSNPIANGASSPNAITINRLPTQPTGINVNGSTNFCFGTGSTQLSVATQPGVTYQWLRNDTVVGGNAPTYTATSPGVYRVRLLAICDTITSTSSVIINSISTPSIPTITTNGSTQICSNANVQLSIPSQTNVTYQWKRDTVNIGSNSNVLLANQAGSYTVQLTNTCGTVAALNPVSVNIIGTPPATPVISAAATNICPGDSVLLSTTAVSNTTYQWRLNGDVISSDTSFVYAKQVGNYTVSVTNNCGSAISSAITINSNQTTQITTQPQNVTTCLGNTVNLSVTALGQGSLTYQWFKNNVSLTGAQSNTYAISSITPSDTGLYKVRVSGGCGQVFSNEIRVSITTPGVWLGTNNTLWTNTANWSCPIIPDSNSQVIISSTAVNMPALTEAVNVGNLVIQNGATLLLNHPNARLNVYGNLTLNGSINHLQGWIRFVGSARQIIPGGVYHKLEISNAQSVELGGQVSIQDTLLITNGKVILNNFNLTLAGITGRVEGHNNDRYIQTNGTGSLTIQQIGSGARTGNVLFPIGRLNYNPAVIQNTGTVDAISIRLLDSVFNQYNGFIPQGNALVSTAVSKTWLISEGVNGGSNINMSIQWSATDELTAFTRTSCHIAQYNGSSWIRQSSTPAIGNNPYTVSLNNITQLNQPFGVGSGNVLPVQLIAFNGKLNNNHIELHWKTASERNNQHYTVIRKNDGKKIGVVSSIGNNKNIKVYTLIDHQIDFTLPNYGYELWQTDLDGRTSKIGETIVSLGYQETLEISCYPNPTNEILNIKIPETLIVAELKLTDALGKEVFYEKLEKDHNGLIQINIKHLNIGIYTLRINEIGYKVIKQ